MKEIKEQRKDNKDDKIMDFTRLCNLFKWQKPFPEQHETESIKDECKYFATVHRVCSTPAKAIRKLWPATVWRYIPFPAAMAFNAVSSAVDTSSLPFIRKMNTLLFLPGSFPAPSTICFESLDVIITKTADCP